MSPLRLRSVIGALALGLVLSVMSAPTPGVAADIDETAPEVTGLTFSAPSYERNDEIVARLQITEPVASAVVLLRDARGEDRYLFANPTDPEDAADPSDALSGATVLYDWPTGTLEVREVRVFDASGNGSTYHRDGTVTLQVGHPTRYTSQQHGLLLTLKDLALDGNDDLAAPVLRGVRLLSPTTARPGDVVSAEIDVAVPGDLLSGYVFLQDAAGRQRTLRAAVRGTRATATVDATWADGPATLVSVLVYDSEGNRATYHRDGRLEQNRFPVQQHDLQLAADLVIDNPDADATPPLLRSVSLREAGPFAVGDRVHLDLDVEDAHAVRVEANVILDGYGNGSFWGATLPLSSVVQPSTTTGFRRLSSIRLTDEAGNTTLWFNNGSAPITSPQVEVNRPTVGITTWCVGPCLPPGTAPRELTVEARGSGEAWVSWRAPEDDGG